jgi:hypothetical protein
MSEIPRYLKAMEVRLARGLNNLIRTPLKAKHFDEYENI